VFTEEVIIDELIDFFGAGSETTQNATQTIVSHFVKNKASLARVRKEFAAVKQAYIEENPELKNLSTEEQLHKTVNLENCQDLEYLNMVIQETLRYESPAQTTGHFDILEDFKAGKYQFRKGDVVLCHMPGLHYNTKEW
jgi:cytochrome P450